MSASSGYLGAAVGAPRLDSSDVDQLIRTTATYYRLLESLDASCAAGASDDTGAPLGPDALAISAQLLAFDGAGGVVGASPNALQVLFELRVDPAPPLGYNLSLGDLVTDRGGGPFPDHAAASNAQGGVLVRAAHVGNGRYEARLAPIRGGSGPEQLSATTYYVALLSESMDADGVKQARIPRGLDSH